MGFFALECECDEVSVSAKRCDESDSVVLGDSSKISNVFFWIGERMLLHKGLEPLP